jgi:hypothetical protein
MTPGFEFALASRVDGALVAGHCVRLLVARCMLDVSSLLSGGASLAAPEAGDAPDAMKMPHPGMRMAPTTPMEKEMHVLQAELARLKPPRWSASPPPAMRPRSAA